MSNNSDSAVAGVIAIVGGILAVVGVIWGIVFGISLISARATPQAGEIGVVRNGPSCVWFGSCFNSHTIRKVIPPGSGSSFIGLGSSVHYYPSSSVQRQYIITGDTSRGDRPGVDVDEIATSDGIRVGLEGAFYFTTAFDGSSRGNALAEDFDNRFGVRTFPVIGTDCGGGTPCENHPWEGSDGWEAFLDGVVRPIIDNDLRQQVGNVSCAQLVSSCALVYNHTQNANLSRQSNQATLTQIQNSINTSLQADIQRVLGQDYFSNIQFLITGKPRLPDAIQNEIDKAQAQFAAVGTAQAQVQQAKLQADANRQKQLGYQACPACAESAILSAIPSNVTTFAPGAGFSITAK